MEPIGTEPTAADYQNLERSGLPKWLIDEAGITRVSTAEGMLISGRNGRGDYAGLAFPYRWPGETIAREYRLRRDHPDIEIVDGAEKERQKYIAAPGRGNMMYFPPTVQPAHLEDPEVPVVITEGEKKALALTVLAWHALTEATEKPRWLPLGLSGVWNWRGTTGKTTGPSGDRRDIKGVIPDFDKIVWRGRPVTIIFDRNASSNSSVMSALMGLSSELRRRGAIVKRFVWPNNETVNGIDDVLGARGPAYTLALIHTLSQAINPTERDQQNSPRTFTQVDTGHRLEFKDVGVVFEVDRMRRERNELVGELTVRCGLAGAKTVDGCLSVADFNFSSARARQDRAKLLAERANAKQLDWQAMLEEFSQRVIVKDRTGSPAVDLRTVERPSPDDNFSLHGLTLPLQHPSILFGDGGAGKSYLALWIAGQVARKGLRVALFDWELSGSDHRDRLERLFPDMPEITYCRCESPLVHELDRLRRVVREEGIQFAIYDSVAFACKSGAEESETANEYFRAVRSIGVGSIHIAHINKSEDGDKKPFGSAFWFNGARMIWYAEAAERMSSTDPLRIGLFNRKSNLGALQNPVSFTLTFNGGRTFLEPANVADSPDLASKLTIRQRLNVLLKHGSMTEEEIASEIDASIETIRKTIKRNPRDFIALGGGRVGLCDRHAS